MGFYTGRSGSLVIDSKPVAKIRDWSLDTTVELINTNTVDSTSNTFVPGIKSATGSATLVYYRLEAGESATYSQFTALLSKIQKVGAVAESDRVLMELRVGSNANDNIQFYAYITSAQVAVSTGELTSVPIQFTVDGDFIAGGVIA
jgi:hypothetical protein